MAQKWVYLFSEGNADMRWLLGSKGAYIADMTRLGIPVPKGFTVTTEACSRYYEFDQKAIDDIQAQIMQYLSKLESMTGKKFGDRNNPLLVSVRSGASERMPGMMDTVLDLGINDEIAEVLAVKSGNSHWAWDCYRRFVQMFSVSVSGIDRSCFEAIVDKMESDRGVRADVDLSTDNLKELVRLFKAEYKAKTDDDFPSDPKIQLMMAVEAAFCAWDNPRAVLYRRDKGMSDLLGTAVSVQEMVFGNMGDDCGTGIAFTRDPATGEKGLIGEFLVNAQGEDVVAGVRTPIRVQDMDGKFSEAFEQLKSTARILEMHYKDMQDMEFTVEHGKFYMLQSRNGRRTNKAAVKIAADLVREGLRTESQAADMVNRQQIESLLLPQIDPAALKAIFPIAKGLGASQGSVCGQIVFDSEDAGVWKAKGKNVMFVKNDMSPEDTHGICESVGVVTSRGGMTSHAAVISRGIGICCVTGCSDISVDTTKKICKIGSKIFHEGDFISVDGNTGCIYEGIIPMIKPEPKGDVALVLSWIEKYKEN